MQFGAIRGDAIYIPLPIRQRAPLTISIDLPTQNNTRVVENPALGTVKQAIAGLQEAAKNEGIRAGGEIIYQEVDSYTAEQASLSLGLSVRYMAAKVRGRLAIAGSAETTSLQIFFKHEMFTVSMETPQTPGALFSSEFTQAILDEQVALGRIGPDNIPVYVSEVTYGRMLVATMTSTYSRSELKAALEASLRAAKLGVALEAESARVFEEGETEIEVWALGGGDENVRNAIRSGNLKEYFNETAEVDLAVPLAYTMKSVSDNAIATVSETTTYTKRECLGTAYFTDVGEWQAAVTKLGATPYLLETTDDNINKAAQLYDNGQTVSNSDTDVQLGPVGTQLSWGYRERPDTGIPTRFNLVTRGPMMWNDRDDSGRRPFSEERLISIGDVRDPGWNDDDFELNVFVEEAVDVFAIGITVVGNVAEAGEKLTAYDKDGQLLKEFRDNMPNEELGAFVGVVSAGVPLSRIEFDEHPEGDPRDHIAVKDMRFGLIEY